MKPILVLGLAIAFSAQAFPVCAITSDQITAQNKTEGFDSGSRGISKTAIDTTKFNTLRNQGFDALYNIDYPRAQVTFEEMIKVAPDHPAGYFYLATNQWMSILNSMRRLQVGVYNSDSFYANNEDKVDPSVDKQFRATVQKAVDVAETRLKETPNDPEILYYLGATYGTLAGYEASVSRKFMSALKNGSKGVDFHRKVIKLDPTYADAYLSIGLYDYVAGTLPLPIKILASIGGIHGSRKRGMEEMQKAVTGARYNSDDARTLLIPLYEREGDYATALKLLDDLAARFPQNYLYGLERAVVMGKVGKRTESFAAFDQLLKNPRSQAVSDLIHYQYAESLFDGGDYKQSAVQYDLVTKIPTANQTLVSMAYLRGGQALDALGQRNKALAQYQIVIKRENVYDSHDLATKYSKKAFVPTAPLTGVAKEEEKSE